jgi:hypothetical protein
MDYFILTRKGAVPADTVVFHGGRRGDERTAGVFTTSERARRFATGWSETDEIRRLNEIDLLAWLIRLYREGVQRIALDPERQPGPGDPRRSSALCLLLADVVGALTDRLHAGGPSDVDLERLVTYYCRGCGKLRRQFAHQQPPRCCDAAMARSADQKASGRFVVQQT